MLSSTPKASLALVCFTSQLLNWFGSACLLLGGGCVCGGGGATAVLLSGSVSRPVGGGGPRDKVGNETATLAPVPA